MCDRGALDREEAIRATSYYRTNDSDLWSRELGLQSSGCHCPSGARGLGPMETVRGSKPGDCFIRVVVHQSRHRYPAPAGSPDAARASQVGVLAASRDVVLGWRARLALSRKLR